MSTKNVHTIQKQLIDITLPDTNTALDWERNKRHSFTALINQQLEKCFKEYDKVGNHLIIEKLDIDLGIFDINNLQTEMPERLYTELQKSLAHYFNISENNIKMPEFKEEQPGSENYNYDEQQGKLKAWYFFLHNGYLPWWGSALANWDEAWLQKLTGNDIDSLKKHLIENDNRLVQRIVTHFKDDFIQQLLERFGITIDTKQAWTWLQKLVKNLAEQKKGDQGKNVQTGSDSFFVKEKFLRLPFIRTKYYINWIMYALGKTKIPDLHSLFDKHPEVFISGTSAGKIDFEAPAIWKKELESIRLQEKERKLSENKRKKAVENISPDSVSQKISNDQNRLTDKEAIKTKQRLLREGESEIGNQLFSKEQSSNDINKKNKFKEDTGSLFINDAGLVLLHPFLPQLFRNCGWLNKNIFLNDHAQTMAVYALFYLATGNTEAKEYELVFHKFLAGIKWETPLEAVDPLNEAQKIACDELIRDVLKHWEPLRNTSPAGLRESYLQRNGKLESNYSGWHLSIEHKTLDILLNRLPWGISLIKLPWKADKFTVTWQ